MIFDKNNHSGTTKSSSIHMNPTKYIQISSPKRWKRRKEFWRKIHLSTNENVQRFLWRGKGAYNFHFFKKN
jgi:hypothetical protein